MNRIRVLNNLKIQRNEWRKRDKTYRNSTDVIIFDVETVDLLVFRIWLDKHFLWISSLTTLRKITGTGRFNSPGASQSWARPWLAPACRTPAWTTSLAYTEYWAYSGLEHYWCMCLRWAGRQWRRRKLNGKNENDNRKNIHIYIISEPYPARCNDAIVVPTILLQYNKHITYYIPRRFIIIIIIFRERCDCSWVDMYKIRRPYAQALSRIYKYIQTHIYIFPNIKFQRYHLL